LGALGKWRQQICWLMAGFTHICRLGIHSRGPAGGLRAVQDHSAGLSSKVPPSGSTSSSLSRVRLSDNYGSWPRVQHGERGDAPPSPPRDGPWRGRASPRWPRRSPICTGWQAASTARMRLPAEPSGLHRQKFLSQKCKIYPWNLGWDCSPP
jgi:hypothetical protein